MPNAVSFAKYFLPPNLRRIRTPLIGRVPHFAWNDSKKRHYQNPLFYRGKRGAKYKAHISKYKALILKFFRHIFSFAQRGGLKYLSHLSALKVFASYKQDKKLHGA